MKEIGILKFNLEQLKYLLFDYYKVDRKNTIFSIKMLPSDTNKDNIDVFELSEQKTIKSLSIERKITISNEDIYNIINEKLMETDYSIDNYIYKYDDNEKTKFTSIQFELKKKEKTKKRGRR